MPAFAVVGGQWGDEGKGKIIDYLAEKAQVVARFSGGSNAGHTVVNPYGLFRMHLIPSGIFHPQAKCLIGSGVLVDPRVFQEELEALHRGGVDSKDLFISERAHLILLYHILLDSLEEGRRGKKALGTTLRGIGPAAVDKVARMGVRVGDLLDTGVLKERLTASLEHKNALLTQVYGAKPYPLEEVYGQCLQYRELLAPFIGATEEIAQEALEAGEVVLLEGAQGALLDIDFGTYPYVTSSSCLAGAAATGLGISPIEIRGVMGVYKAYNTRVGKGPLPTELGEVEGNRLRERAGEYGTTTGRPRRCGWFDAAAARFTARLNGCTTLAITRLDVLDIFPTLKIGTGYLMGGREVSVPPASGTSWERCLPVYEEFPGWREPLSLVRRFQDLPLPAQAYIRKIEELVGCPVSVISVGPRREETIQVRPFLPE